MLIYMNKNYKFLVNTFTILYCGKNSFAITFIMVKRGTAITIPVIPNKVPEIKTTKKISNGCEFTLLEKIIGDDILLSIN